MNIQQIKMNRKQITAITSVGMLAITGFGILAAPALGRSVPSQETIGQEVPDNLLAGRRQRQRIYRQLTCKDARENVDAAIIATRQGLNCRPSTHIYLEDNLRNWSNGMEAMSCTSNVGTWNPELGRCIQRPYKMEIEVNSEPESDR